MGNSVIEKGIKPSLKLEFETLRQNKQRDYLTISEIIKFTHPDNFQFTFDHLGNLFVLNSNRSGVFTLQDLYKFAEFCQNNLKNVKTYEFQSQLQAATTQVLLQHLQRENGENDIVDWVEQMLLKNEKNPITFERMGDTKFIRIQTVKILYEIFKIKMMNGMEIQQFFYLLQQCGEEAGLMAPDAKELDEYAPVEMGKEFARQYLRGFAKLMREVGFNDDQSMQQDISMLEASIHNNTNALNRDSQIITTHNQSTNPQVKHEFLNRDNDYQTDNKSVAYYGIDQEFEDDEVDDYEEDEDDDEDDDEEEDEEEQIYNLNQLEDQDGTRLNTFQNKFKYQPTPINQTQSNRQFENNNSNNNNNNVNNNNNDQNNINNNNDNNLNINYNDKDEENLQQNQDDNFQQENYFLYQQKQNFKSSNTPSKQKSQSINNSLNQNQYNQDQGQIIQKQIIMIPPLQVNLISKVGGIMHNNLM